MSAQEPEYRSFSHPGAAVAFFVGLIASPAAATWVIRSEHSRRRRILRTLGVVATLVVAALLLVQPLRWEITTALWATFALLGSGAVALAARRAPQPRTPSAEGWARATLRALAPALFIFPNLLLFSRLLGWALTGNLQARLNPQAVDPQQFFGLAILDMLWVAPLGILFVALSYRRARLRAYRDLVLAAGAWSFFLLLREVLVMGSFGALRSQMVAVEAFASWAQYQEIAIGLVLVILTVPVVYFLAWGPGTFLRRGAAVTLLMIGVFVNLSFLFGVTSRAQFAIARAYERRADVAGALSWYRRSLATHPSPLFNSYLQHRVGLLHYKLGNEEAARQAFESVVTSHTARTSLVEESAYYLDRLDTVAEGERIVLEGVEVQTEHRSAYCAPNTLSLVFGFWGRELSPAAVGEAVALIGAGTLGSRIRFIAEEHGLEHILYPFAGLEDLRWLIDRGLPALVYTPGHVLSVFGYDERLATVVAYDTAKWDIWVDRPFDDLLADWGQDGFLLGVVVPTELDGPLADAVQERFGGARSRAAWFWWLAKEQPPNGERAIGLLRRALAEDPAFFPAAFALLRSTSQQSLFESRRPEVLQWLDDRVDEPELLELAQAQLEREHAATADIAYSLAEWYRHRSRWEALLELTVELSRSTIEQRLSTLGGLAAARLKQWERVAFLLADEGTEGIYDAELDPLIELYRAHLELGQRDAAASVLSNAVRIVVDDRLEWILDEAEGLSEGRPNSFLEEFASHYSRSRPGDPRARLQTARLNLEVAREPTTEERRERLQRARQAAHVALALSAPGEALRAEAEELLNQIEAARRELPAGGRSTSGTGGLSPATGDP